MFGQISANFVFISNHFSLPDSVSAIIASTGHSGSQTPQSIHSSGLKQDMEFKTEILENNSVMIDDQFIGVIKGLKLDLDLKKGALETDIKSLKKAARQSIGPELEKRIQIIIDTGLIELNNDSKIYWNNFPIAKLSIGNDYLNPNFDLIVDDTIEQKHKKN